MSGFVITTYIKVNISFIKKKKFSTKFWYPFKFKYIEIVFFLLLKYWFIVNGAKILEFIFFVN